MILSDSQLGSIFLETGNGTYQIMETGYSKIRNQVYPTIYHASNEIKCV